MNQYQMKDPQGFQNLNQLMLNGGNPEKLIRQEMQKINPSEVQNILIQARNLGVPENLLAQIQNMR